MRVLYLCGGGNPEGVRLALRVNRRDARWDEIHILDDDASRHGESILGVEIVGPFSLLGEADPERSEVANLVARTTPRRRAARQKIQSYDVPFTSLVDVNVDMEGVEIASDVLVYQNAVIGPEVAIDEGSVVFMGAIVGHESRLARGCVVAANAVLNARVRLADGAYIGTNAAVLPELSVGAWATVGACSMVVQDVPDGATLLGVPGRVVMKRGSEPTPSEPRPKTRTRTTPLAGAATRTSPSGPRAGPPQETLG